MRIVVLDDAGGVALVAAVLAPQLLDVQPMRRMIRGLSLCVVSAACTSGGSDGAMTFEAEAALLPGFEMDTGFLPADQPVQVRLVARAGGAVKAHAEATG